MLRRLELLPGIGQIQCKLESVSLNDEPVYEAISYHWGGTAEKHEIVCNSASLFITDSLHSALVRFRRLEQSRHLWADQLCINQADSDERGRQVGFMREIYENAIQTLVWLACTPLDKRTIYELSSAEAAEYNLPEATSRIWKAFQILFLRPWFARMWVIQEVNVSKSVAIYCHNSEISAADFMAGVECANELGPLWLVGNMSLDNPFRVLKNQSQDVERPSLISLLLGFSYFQATDPRDKVYALLGLAPTHERANIIPNYNLTPKQVFHSTTIAILEQSGNLDI
ncbi:HET-domain-containing protein, partial [Hyaloscypha hepaticicola]